jgi:hypothetical protein
VDIVMSQIHAGQMCIASRFFAICRLMNSEKLTLTLPALNSIQVAQVNATKIAPGLFLIPQNYALK